MTPDTKNMAASVRQRLYNLHKIIKSLLMFPFSKD